MGVLTSVFRAAMPLEQLGPLTAQRVVDLLAGPPASSGVRVTEDAVRGLPAAHACNRVLAEGIAALPFAVFERQEPRGRRRATEHPLYRLLHEQANPYMTAYKFRETMQGHLGFWGNAFANIERNRYGDPIALWPMRPDCLHKMWIDENKIMHYVYQMPDGSPYEGTQFDIFHVRGLSKDGLMGISPLTVFREAFGQSIAAREYGSRFFSQDARPGGVLQTKGKLSTEAAQRMGASWRAAHEGLNHAHRVAILEEGVEWHQVGMSNEDAQFVELQQFNLGDMARIFNIKPHKIADLSRATFSNIEQVAIEHVTDTLMPWLVNWEQQVGVSLIKPAEQGRYYAKHIVAGLLRGDSAARSAFYSAGINGGWFSPDDIREMEDLNPLPDGLGDVYYRPLNMQAVGPGADAAPRPESGGLE